MDAHATVRPTGKKTPGGAGTHTGHTGAHGHTDHTDKPHNHPNPPTHGRRSRPAQGRPNMAQPLPRPLPRRPLPPRPLLRPRPTGKLITGIRKVCNPYRCAALEPAKTTVHTCRYLAAVESVAVSAVARSCGCDVCRWVWVDGCEVRPCDLCARVRPCVPRLPPVSFYR